MAESMEKPPKDIARNEEDEEEEQSFEELGLDPRLIRALMKKGIEKPTPIQLVAIPLILVSFCCINRSFYDVQLFGCSENLGNFEFFYLVDFSVVY
jgi:superfamily II DNA/RNA helicase